MWWFLSESNREQAVMSRQRDLLAKEPYSPPPLLQKRRSGKISPARRLGSTGFEPEKDLSQNPYTRFSRVSAAVTPNSHKQVFNLLEFFYSSPPCFARLTGITRVVR